MSSRRQTTTQPERAARALFREYGFRVEAVSMIRQQQDGEFMCIVEWQPEYAARAIELLTRPENVATEITRIHAGDYATRIYLRFALPDPTAPHYMTSWDEINAALARA